MNQTQLIIGKIQDLNTERLSMQQAYFRAEEECERLRKIIKRLKRRKK